MPADKSKSPLIHIVLPCVAIVFVVLGVLAATVGGEREPGYLMLAMGAGVLFANGMTAFAYSRTDRKRATPAD